MPSALVLGGGLDQLPLVVALRDRGFRTVLLDHAPTPPAAAECDVHVRRSAIDPAAVNAEARAHDVAFIVSAAMDAAVPLIADASRALGLPTIAPPDAARAAVSKSAMKDRFARAGIPTSPAVVVDGPGGPLGQESGLRFPVVVKPDRGTGSLGVAVVHDPGALTSAVSDVRAVAGRERVVIEEYVPGPEVTLDCFTRAGRTTIVCSSTLVPTAAARPGFSFIRCISPHDMDAGEFNAVQNLAHRVATAFDIDSGPWTLQAKLGGEPTVIELGLRIAGGRKPRFIRTATGVDVVGAYIDDLSGAVPDIAARPTDRVTVLSYVYGRAGRVAGYRGVDAAIRRGGCEYVQLLREEGTTLGGGLAPRDRVLEFCVTGGDSAAALTAESDVLAAIDCVEASGHSLLRRELTLDPCL